MLKKLFDPNKKNLKRLEKDAEKVVSLSPTMGNLSDEQLQGKTKEFKERLSNGETLEDIKIEAFAVAREAAKRVLGMEPFKVQIMGGLVLHEGNIAEMRTGEGKTLTSTMPVYLNALEGKSVHVVTVNEYLSKRDAEEMSALYEFLGLTVGLNLNSLTNEEKQKAYKADILYSTNAELGFDSLRDNMVYSPEEKVQRLLDFVVIDEVDSVLIDEARTPLVISGNALATGDLYAQTNQIIPYLQRDIDYTYNEETKALVLTEEGISKVEKGFNVDNLFDVKHMSLNHAVNQSLRAHVSLQKNVDYLVQDGEIVIIDELTGRMLKGRRYADGLHQALEAKEGLPIKRESKTLAKTTFQNYFRKYKKIAGMTGTAKTEKDEFLTVYNMEIVEIPTNKSIKRIDHPDIIFKTLNAKYNAIIEDVKEKHNNGQPVLIGTVTIETSETISKLLTEEGIPHNVLNAKQHEQEAEIIAKAGEKGAVTVATNMAGRGTDIKPGEGVIELGGLAVIGTERHEARRIDNQLRGRSGRQGDPGSTQFYLSMEDPIMLKLGSERMQSMLNVLGVKEDQPIQSKMLTKAVESAQTQAEGGNYDARKVLLQYDDVLREQREIIFDERDEVLLTTDTKEIVKRMINKTITRIVEDFTSRSEPWDLEGLINEIEANILTKGQIEISTIEGKNSEEIISIIEDLSNKNYEEKESKITPEIMCEIEKDILLKSIDLNWVAHIEKMEELRQGIHLRAYAQIDPLKEFSREGMILFDETIQEINEYVAKYISKIRPKTEEELRIEESIKQQIAEISSSLKEKEEQSEE